MIPDDECAGSTCLPLDRRKTQRYGWTVEGPHRRVITMREKNNTLDDEDNKNLLKSMGKATLY